MGVFTMIMYGILSSIPDPVEDRLCGKQDRGIHCADISLAESFPPIGLEALL
jgi:hypothetical protein